MAILDVATECIGHFCSLATRCEECKDWSEVVMNAHIRHRRQLMSAKARKARQKGRKANAALGLQLGDFGSDSATVISLSSTSVPPTPSSAILPLEPSVISIIIISQTTNPHW